MTGLPTLILQPMQDAIDAKEKQAEDLALDGDFDAADLLLAEIEDLRERLAVGEVYYINI